MKNIKIGKNIIENLTEGMYENCKIIFREYIQNAADQIDKAINQGLLKSEEACIDITINNNKRNIFIEDNATGIKFSEVHKKLADIADSQKDRYKNKGFRGIGRLGGLAYCETLRFITSYKGENVQTEMIWDANKCSNFINDPSINISAEEVLKQVISYHINPCDIEKHFFRVELINIKSTNNELLNVSSIRDYISEVAPLPYSSKFYFSSEIKKFLKENKLYLNEYQVYINGENVFKGYTTYLYEKHGNSKKQFDEINNISFKKFYNKEEDLLAWMWFGICAFDKAIPKTYNLMQGLRLRKQNIQIGDNRTLVKLFNENRGNSYFIGEIHAVHRNLIPNARRDNFNDNNTKLLLETELRYFFRNKLYKIYHKANDIKNCYKKIKKVKELNETIECKNKKGFVSKEEKYELKDQLYKKKDEANKSLKILKNIKLSSNNDDIMKKVFKIVENKYKTDKININEESIQENNINEEMQDNTNNKNTNLLVDELTSMPKREKKLVSKIYKVIKNNLSPEMSESLINKIQKELKING